MKKEVWGKIYEKNIKPLVKMPREVRQMVLIVGGGWITGSAVEGEKSDFCDS